MSPRRYLQGLLPHPSLLKNCQIRSLVKDVKSRTVLVVQRQLSLEFLPDVLHLVCLKRGKVDGCVQVFWGLLAFPGKTVVITSQDALKQLKYSAKMVR